MSKAREFVRMALIIAAALALAALGGILVAQADGPVIWKQHCPAYADVQIQKADDWGGVHVLCVLSAEEKAR